MKEDRFTLSENPVNPVKKWLEHLKVQRNFCILHVSSIGQEGRGATLAPWLHRPWNFSSIWKKGEDKLTFMPS